MVMVEIPLLMDLPVSWNTVSTQIVSIKVAKLEPSPRMGMLRLHDECVKHLFIIFGVKVTRKDPYAAIRGPEMHNSSLRHNNHPNNLNVIQPCG
jgi:hypothetical protein